MYIKNVIKEKRYPKAQRPTVFFLLVLFLVRLRLVKHPTIIPIELDAPLVGPVFFSIRQQ